MRNVSNQRYWALIFCFALSVFHSKSSIAESSSSALDAVKEFLSLGITSPDAFDFHSDHEAVADLQRLLVGYQSRDLKMEADYSFGVGELKDGSSILFGWRNQGVESTGAVDAIQFRDLARIYTDDRLSEVKNEAEMKNWKNLRAKVLGAFIAVKREESHFEVLYPHAGAGQSTFDQLKVSGSPVVVRIYSGNQTPLRLNDLLSVVGSFSSRVH